MRVFRSLVACVPIGLLLGGGCGGEPITSALSNNVSCDQQPPTELTFRKQIRTKMYIAGNAVCDPWGVLTAKDVLLDPKLYPEYMALCGATRFNFHENPQDGEPNVDDARILTEVNLVWTCHAGQTRPTSATVIPGPVLGGRELPTLYGVALTPTIKNEITANGIFKFVAAGRPPKGAGLALTHVKDRASPWIWHRVAGTIACSTDARGVITSDVTVKFEEATKFPSHRVYLYDLDASGNTKLDRKVGAADVPQQQLSNLWHLPPVGAP